MIQLLKNVNLFAPQPKGIVDILIADGRIAKIAPTIEESSVIDRTTEVEGATAVPGFVDTLVHITGGGGEGGFATRTPELNVDEAIRAGVTSLVGALGTDSVTRTLPDLYGKARQLSDCGLNCVIQTGSYHFPVKTLTGSIESDLLFIDRVIGVGELAIADHRSSIVTPHELARIAHEVRVGSMLSGKKGVVSIHVGDQPEGLQILIDAHEKYSVSLDIFYPTHISRTDALLTQGIEFAKRGGFIDFTTSTNDSLLAHGEIRASDAIMDAIKRGAPINKLTMSSDAQGSLPTYDEDQNLVGIDVGRIDSLHDEAKRLCQQHGLSVADAFSLITENPAKAIGLKGRGVIEQGCFADLVILASDLNVDSVIANGNWLLENQILNHSTLRATAYG